MIAVIGAAGQLGSAFSAVLGADCLPLTRSDIDLEDTAVICPTIQSLDVDAVINCAAYTAVDQAEEDELRAFAVNATAVGELATTCHQSGKRFVTFSTDYVFDGAKAGPYTESDQPNPLGVYGHTKLEGERLALASHPESLVVRTSWVLSGTHRNFAATMLRLIGEGPVQVVDDQIGHPTLVDDLASKVLACLEEDVAGVLHLANQGTVSWYQLARECADIAGLDASVVTPCRTEDFPRPAPRPRNSVLDSERLSGLGLPEMPHYRPGLEKAIDQLRAAASSA